ncbi:hypothetical protein ACHAXR_005007, partial [Thalassiosira sp. AJA248-18]
SYHIVPPAPRPITSPAAAFVVPMKHDERCTSAKQPFLQGTPLRLVPMHHDESTTCQKEIAKNSGTEAIKLDPLLLKVLLRSSNLASLYNAKKCDSNTNTRESTGNDVHPVLLSSYDGSVHGAMGWLEQVNVEDVNDNSRRNATECHVTVHLTYICSNSSRCRGYFNNKTNLNADVRVKGKDLLMRALVGEVVAEGGILGVDMGKYDDVSYITSEMGCYDDEHQEMAFFMVDKILIRDTPSTEGREVRFLRLWPYDSFAISLDPSDDAISNESEGIPRMSQSNRQPTAQGDHENFSCPGYENILQELMSLAEMNDPNGSPTAVMLSGCSGVGKSRMAAWFERELSGNLASSRVAVSSFSAKDVLLEEASSSFDQTKALYQTNLHQSSNNATFPDRLLVIDDLDAIIGNADDASSATINSNLESEQLRALNAIVKLIDTAINDGTNRFFVLGLSRASWAQLPLQLARVGRFEKVVTMPPPTLDQRRRIFEFWLSTLPLFDTAEKESTISRWADLLAPRTAGCVAADIRRICADALTSAAARVPRKSVLSSESDEFAVEWKDIREAARTCVPSQLSSMDVIPSSLGDNLGINEQSMDTKQEFELAWKSFGGYDMEKKRLYRTVVRPWKYHIMETASISNPNDGAQASSVEAALGMSKPSGVLFHGPPGVGKTFAAMCLASSLGLHCVKVRASEVFNQWLGGSEANIRSIFSQARAASPCILFFDELDSLATNREGGEDATSGVQSRILTTLLNEMDGITNAGGKQGVLVVAATNRLDAIDAALLRPGRLEEHVLLSYPKSSCIQDILKIQTAKMPLDASADFMKLSDKLEASNASCAEIEGICRDACLIAMRRCSEKGVLDNLSVLGSDFDEAFHRIKRNTIRR